MRDREISDRERESEGERKRVGLKDCAPLPSAIACVTGRSCGVNKS